jgi:hypothetical protein
MTFLTRSERREFEYIRHGTQTLIANFDVATGEVITPTVGETRTEEDFAEHIRQTIELDPQSQWFFVMDQLNTHKSEALVRLVAEQCGLQDDLGVKGKSRILQSMESRSPGGRVGEGGPASETTSNTSSKRQKVISEPYEVRSGRRPPGIQFGTFPSFSRQSIGCLKVSQPLI